MKIVLFEDNERQYNSLLSELRSIDPAIDYVRFDGGGKNDGTFESRLFEQFQDARFSQSDLIVSDRDLSTTDSYIGLSESAVRNVASKLGIPECSYQRNEESIGLLRQREASISVSLRDGFPSCAEQIISIAKGFASIRSGVSSLPKQPDLKSLGRLLATILRKPEYAEKISLYSSGDQNRLADLISLPKENWQQPLSTFLGYWLWDSILRFPGVLVNNVAAASYLNILTEEFVGDVANLFSSAKYQGPFAIDNKPFYWRAMLDDLISDSGFADGACLAEASLARTVQRSQCIEDALQTAGYYCMLTESPVSFENSYPGLNWFPRGADLARLSKTNFDQIGPWLGE